MKKIFLLCVMMGLLVGCSVDKRTIAYEWLNDSTVQIKLSGDARLLLLPIQEDSKEVGVKLHTDNPLEDVYMDIRLAEDSVDYFVPLRLPLTSDSVVLTVRGLSPAAFTWQKLTLADTFDTSDKDYFHPTLHHTPPYGWMNDPNGLFYKDGEYHLYYQFNPYGSMWGNMHWRHSVSTDLLHWQDRGIVLRRDTLGHIFSGSCIIDKDNVAGFGNGAVLAYYTSHRWLPDGRQYQAQSLAYSVDNGYTFTKYSENPILEPSDGISDFRDPKVFWYEPLQKWYMIVSADTEMRFYRSDNLKAWEYVSSFGQGWGAQPSQFECPDFFELPVDGKTDDKKWVMIVNINPGCLFGGSATQYFVGNFDGVTFKPDTPAETVRWLDYGKDHYAFVTFHNTESQVVGMPWVSNWQYANITPFKQSRGVNGFPRELFLFTKDSSVYVGSKPIEQLKTLRKHVMSAADFSTSTEFRLSTEPKQQLDAGEITFRVTPGTATVVGVDLYNEHNERVCLYFDMQAQKMVLDRTQSGLTDFGSYATTHAIENHDKRKEQSVNYQNDFALATWAPLSLLKSDSYDVQIIIDKSVLEIFVDGGRIAMTNLVFPSHPYGLLRFYAEGGESRFSNIDIYRLQ